MRMTIDEIIQSIQIIKAQAEWDYPIDWQIVLDGAIETMRRYQKIAQVLSDWKAMGYNENDGLYSLLMLIRVVEDGNVD